MRSEARRPFKPPPKDIVTADPGGIVTGGAGIVTTPATVITDSAPIPDSAPVIDELAQSGPDLNVIRAEMAEAISTDLERATITRFTSADRKLKECSETLRELGREAGAEADRLKAELDAIADDQADEKPPAPYSWYQGHATLDGKPVDVESLDFSVTPSERVARDAITGDYLRANLDSREPPARRYDPTRIRPGPDVRVLHIESMPPTMRRQIADDPEWELEIGRQRYVRKTPAPVFPTKPQAPMMTGVTSCLAGYRPLRGVLTSGLAGRLRGPRERY